MNCFLVSLAPLLFAAPAPPVATWPEWRGPAHDGVSTDKGIASEWGPDKNIVWKLKMPGMGSSTPAVWGDRIFLTSADQRDFVLFLLTWNRSFEACGK